MTRLPEGTETGDRAETATGDDPTAAALMDALARSGLPRGVL